MTENPYKSPVTERGPPPGKRTTSKTVGSILILLAMLPAAGTACFTVCLVVAEGVPRNPKDPYGLGSLMIGMVVGVIVGAVVLGLMIWWAISLLRIRVPQPRIWTKIGGTEIDASYLTSTETEVLLRDGYGNELRVPLVQLSEADRAWLKANR